MKFNKIFMFIAFITLTLVVGDVAQENFNNGNTTASFLIVLGYLVFVCGYFFGVREKDV